MSSIAAATCPGRTFSWDPMISAYGTVAKCSEGSALVQRTWIQVAVTDRSISELISEMIRERLTEDAEDLKTFRERADESVISYESLLQDLQAHGKL
jgi:hypothetical protein